MPRKVTNKLIELVEDGALSWEAVARAALCYMSEDDVADMARSNELIADEETEDETDEDEDTATDESRSYGKRHASCY